MRVPGPVPRDVDTWDDYEAVLAARVVSARPPARAGAPAALVERVPDVAALAAGLDAADYLADEPLATAMFLSLRLPQPLLLEGEAGVGKTEAARALAAALGTPLIRLQCYEGMDSSEALYEWNYPRQLLRIRLAEAGGEDVGEDDLFGREYLVRRPVLEAIEHPGPLPAVLLDRRARPRRPRLRGVPARAARRRGGHGAGARDDPRDGPARGRADVEPHARPARRAQAALPVPLDRLPVAGARGRDRAPPRAGLLARRWPATWSRRSRGCARPTCRSRPGSRRASTGSPRSSCWARERLDADAADRTLGAVLKYREDQEVVRAAGLETLVAGRVMTHAYV